VIQSIDRLAEDCASERTGQASGISPYVVDEDPDGGRPRQMSHCTLRHERGSALPTLPESERRSRMTVLTHAVVVVMASLMNHTYTG
jgi:hypothetical protein